jgi:uncharacterized membrane protein
MPPSRFRLSVVGLVVAAGCFCASLTPSLAPRDAVMQGVLAGIVALLGYELGLLLDRFWRFMELPRPPLRWASPTRLVVGLGAAGAIAFCLTRADDWQNATRLIFGLAPVDTAHPATVGGIALAAVVAGWLILRLLGMLFDRIAAVLGRVLPPRVGLVATFAIVLWLVWAVTDGVLVRRAFEAADASFEAADLLIEPRFPRPSEPWRTGSAASLVEWQEMGRRGREFVARVPTVEEIGEFHDGEVMEPVRVYVGRRAADTPEQRARLALDELLRVGGFDRSTLVVVVPVGTGWMDPGGHDTLEFILAGDVATVAVQYSYLTSVLSLLADPEYGVEQARALFETVYAHWAELPEDARPELYVHGLSQGAFNSQMTLPLLDMLGDPIAGGLWAGSPFISPFWQRIRDDRDPASPAWRPVYGNSSLARVLNQHGAGSDIAAPWGPIRFVFLNYPSDAIVQFTFASAFRRPDWMGEPRPPDVAPEFRWYPLVTMFQLALDMMISLQVPGFGHYYHAPDYIEAWAELIEPEGWSDARAAELKAIFAERGPAW